MRFLPVMLAIVALAGCLDGQPADTDDTGDAVIDTPALLLPDPLPSGEAAPEALRVQDCYEHLAVLPTPAGDMDDLPEGFELDYFNEDAGLATVVLISLLCSHEGSEDPSNTLYALLSVIPPEELAGEGMNALLLGAAAEDDRSRDVLTAWHVPEVLDVSIDVSYLFTPVAREGRVTLGDSFVTSVQTAGTPGVQEAGTARSFYMVDERVAYMDVTWTESLTMEGTAEASEVFVPPTVMPGVGVVNWGDGYDLELRYVPLPL